VLPLDHDAGHVGAKIAAMAGDPAWALARRAEGLLRELPRN
jgi:hypothetical protein